MRQNMPRMSLLDVDVDAEANAAGAAAEAVSNLSTHNGSNLMCACMCVCVWKECEETSMEWAIPRISLLTDMHMLCVLC